MAENKSVGSKVTDTLGLGCAAALILVVSVGGMSMCSTCREKSAAREREREKAEAKPRAAPEAVEMHEHTRQEQAAPPSKEPTRCVLKIGKAPTENLIVFPTEDGFDEFGKAAATSDERAMNVAITANGGYWVKPGTACAFLNVGLLGTTKVRVLEGPHVGKPGYVPTEWATGN